MMRLAVTLQSVHPSKGGAETYVADLCRRLDSAEHEVSLFANTWDPAAFPSTVRAIAVPADYLQVVGTRSG